ncbi:MAG: agmatine deiminase family protein [Planctomycetota bacterium]
MIQSIVSRAASFAGSIVLLLIVPVCLDAQFYRQFPQQGYGQAVPMQQFGRPGFGQQPGSPYQQRPYQQQPRGWQPQASPRGAVTPEQAQRLYNRPATDPPPERSEGQVYPRIGGEFEPQNAIVISVSELLPQHHVVFRGICEATSGHVRLIVLYNSGNQVREAIKALATSEADLSHVYFKQLEMNTIWLRDFGPRMCELENGQSMSLDFFYDGQRPQDDSFPLRWADMTETDKMSAHWTMHGGNLLSNGRGLGLTTSRIFEDNRITFPNPRPGSNPGQEAREMVYRELKQYCNLDRLIVLQPLQNEKTRHVDMFATFLNHDTVLIARLDPRRDPVNARILDRNAEYLEDNVTVDGEPIKVHRIDVPPAQGTSWSPFTNNIMANGLILMPVLNRDNPQIVQRALQTYRELLPEYTVVGIDTTTLKDLEGALHCMSVNIPAYASLPAEMTTYEAARTWAQQSAQQ